MASYKQKYYDAKREYLKLRGGAACTPLRQGGPGASQINDKLCVFLEYGTDFYYKTEDMTNFETFEVNKHNFAPYKTGSHRMYSSEEQASIEAEFKNNLYIERH